jgi:hypothetical protein
LREGILDRINKINGIGEKAREQVKAQLKARHAEVVEGRPI